MNKGRSEYIKLNNGGDISFEKIFKENFSKLVVFASKYIEDQNICEDIVQEVFMTLWESTIKFETELSLMAFLYKSVCNKSLNNLKHNRIKDKYSEENLKRIESDEYLMENVIDEEYSYILHKAIEKLTPQCKEVIGLHLKGLRNNEISENLRISLSTVKTHKMIAYKQLREDLKSFYVLFLGIYTKK